MPKRTFSGQPVTVERRFEVDTMTAHVTAASRPRRSAPPHIEARRLRLQVGICRPVPAFRPSPVASRLRESHQRRDDPVEPVDDRRLGRLDEPHRHRDLDARECLAG